MREIMKTSRTSSEKYTKILMMEITQFCSTLPFTAWKKFVQLLLEKGADPNATTKFEKHSPILIACMNNDHEIMKLLLSSHTQ